MNIALAQINPTIGDLQGNSVKIVQYAHRAHRSGADLVVFPEMSVTGYPPHDLLEDEAFLDAVEQALRQIAEEVPFDIGVLVGAPIRNEADVGKRLFNAALCYAGGQLVGRALKTLLPTYDVYDEYRYFEPARSRACIEFRGVRLGVHICEDMWNMEEGTSFRMYAGNPLDDLARDGAEIFVSLSATPYAAGKRDQRTRLLETICRHYARPIVMVNQVGANTELVFDGDSRVQGADGRVLARAPLFEEALIIWDTDASRRVVDGEADTAADDEREAGEVEELHDALVLGIRDYFHKSGVFAKALVGLSGGIDSATTCSLAVEALGADRVVGVTMPSEYSSRGSVEDSRTLAKNFGIEFHTIPIQSAFDTFREMLADVMEDEGPSIVEENIQARARAVTLMGISNAFGYLVLSTGNKSEMAVGYSTLYGDMAGGLAVLSDVFKTQVYALARYVNGRAGREVIPQKIIEKAPSAELKPNQKDQDTLPSYEVLDTVLRLYVEEAASLEAIVSRTGYERRLVANVLAMVDRNEYKRRQAPPGLRVSKKAFGSGRRLPIVMRRSHRSTGEPATERA